MSQSVIVTTPEQLRHLVIEAVAAALPPPSPTNRGQRLLSPQEVEEVYGKPFTERNLERWRAEGIGPAYTTFGRRIYYESDVLEAYITNGRVKTGEN